MKKKALAIFAVPFAIAGCSGSSLPNCDDSETQSLVNQIVDDMPLVKMAEVKFITLKEVKEQGYNDKTELRSCEAVLVTTAGEDLLQYSIKWQSKEKNHFYVEARIQ